MKRVRIEHFGAWVALDDATLVALDREAARACGIDGAAAWGTASAAQPELPLEAHVAVTSQCPVACNGCYQDASPAGEHVLGDELLATLDALAEAGVFTVAFGGGEPLSRSDIGALASAARARGLTPAMTTSGIGLTSERATSLRDFAQINVSHDGVDGGYRDVRGFDGEHHADRAIKTLVAANISVGVNLVLTRQTFDGVMATADHVRALGACELQLLRYKPAGRAASLDYLARRLTLEQARGVYTLLAALSARHGNALAIRIDCAMIPFLSLDVHDPSALALWGVFGCEAGRHLTAVTRDGAIAPCSFAKPSTRTRASSIASTWGDDAALERFRSFVASPTAPCDTCVIRDVCRGGCKVVSEHLVGAFVSDPECPRVVAHERARIGST